MEAQEGVTMRFLDGNIENMWIYDLNDTRSVRCASYPNRALSAAETQQLTLARC
jgi:hypothetical protein